MADFGFTEEGLVIAGNLMATWEEIDKERNYYRLQGKILVKVSFSYSRGDWEDHQIFDNAEWQNIKAALEDKHAWYHDFAGKHSEVCLEFWDERLDLEEITDMTAITDFYNSYGMSTGNLDIIYAALYQKMDDGEITKNEDGTFTRVE